jgi:ADP-ribose pyrophosphatase
MKIPDSAKRVFKGIIFDVYQWEQEMFDGTTKTFEMLKRVDIAEVIAVVGDKILIQLQQQPGRENQYISLPGGRMDEGEDILVGAKRELLEETGYVSDDWELWHEVHGEWKIEDVLYFYIARNAKYQQDPQLDGGEIITNKLITFEEFLGLTEDKTFHETELVNFLLRLKLDPNKKEEFRKLLFK